MAKIPKTPSEIFGEFTDDFKRIFETDLTAIILYGSGAKGDYVHKKSDINFMIVLTEPGIHNLFLTFDVLKKWRKRAVSTPLFLTKEYIESSLDSFPLEFWEMKKFHQIVYGDDVLKKIEISRSDLRLQCEREVKGKLLHLQQNFLNSEKKPHRLRALLVLSIPTFGTLFNALLYLKNEVSPNSRKEIFVNTAGVFGLDQQVFETILKLRYENLKLKSDALLKLTQSYIEEIRKLSQFADKL
ncbi:hypothetical protein BMS3Abin05_00352 [bacterium BMS3Abin05]|nr:hypothetical protein BMS3Abin05_00352 [bacterium BMS3Abin05]GBE27282.1 hypothetical protein BMS3Bbin03_01206 [bacterium BMS3Bbin03]HDK36180.1 nucleotidyltransferase domain-containing protein [Bacteroidota bacterium]HDL78314.1 nucleotidyltransferase domain-containing protein [Bacteroidota bacterium]